MRENKKAALAGAAEQTQLKAKRITKLERTEAALKLPGGLNRFEAERIGEHALNSTVAILRKRYGKRLLQRWEKVPSRFCETGVRVLRYWLVGAN